jgi:hypothetical protein
MSGDHNMHCSANQPDCYGDGNVYRGVRSKDSAVKTIWVGLTDEEIAEGAKQSWVDKQAFESAVWWAEEKLREKNRG